MTTSTLVMGATFLALGPAAGVLGADPAAALWAAAVALLGWALVRFLHWRGEWRRIVAIRVARQDAAPRSEFQDKRVLAPDVPCNQADRAAARHPQARRLFVQQTIHITDVDSRRLDGLIQGSRPRDPRDARNVELLERHLDDAQVIPAGRIGPNVVTMNSEVHVRDLDAHEAMTFRVVFPGAANAGAGKISVLAPLGMAVLGRQTGDAVSWPTPGGLRRLRVERILYQPEREGRDVA